MPLPNLGALGLGPPTGPMVTYTAPPGHDRETRLAKRAKGQRNDQCAISFEEFRNGEEVWTSPNSEHLYKPQEIYRQIHTNGYVDPMTREPIPYDEATCLYDWLRAHGFNVAPPPDPPPDPPQDSTVDSDLQQIFAAAGLDTDPWRLFTDLTDEMRAAPTLVAMRTPILPLPQSLDRLFVPMRLAPSYRQQHSEELNNMFMLNQGLFDDFRRPDMPFILNVYWVDFSQREEEANPLAPPGIGGAFLLTLNLSDHGRRPEINTLQKLHLCLTLLQSQARLDPPEASTLETYRKVLVFIFFDLSIQPENPSDELLDALEQRLRSIFERYYPAAAQMMRPEILRRPEDNSIKIRLTLSTPTEFARMSSSAKTYLFIENTGKNIQVSLQIALKHDEFATFVLNDAAQKMPSEPLPLELTRVLQGPLNDFFLPGTRSDQVYLWQSRSKLVGNMMGMIDVVVWHTWRPLLNLLTQDTDLGLLPLLRTQLGEQIAEDPSFMIHNEQNNNPFQIVSYRTQELGSSESLVQEHINPRWVFGDGLTARRAMSRYYQWLMPEFVRDLCQFGVNINLVLR